MLSFSRLLCGWILFQYAHGFKFGRQREASKCKADTKELWTYRGSNGPQYWGERYPSCNGVQQSPIAISSRTAIRDRTLMKLTMKNYEVPVTRATIQNNGHTVQISPTDGVDRTIDVMGDTYRLTQLHFHWGDKGSRGAEHTIDGFQYSMELHFVHQNEMNQIAVVGVFFEELKKETPELQTIIAQFPQVMYKDSTSELRGKLILNNLLPANPSSHFRYQGSLTTPDCAEGVTWSVLPKPMPIGKNQMKEFRKLYSATKTDAGRKCKISDNFRPIQPLNDRPVFVSQ